MTRTENLFAGGWVEALEHLAETTDSPRASQDKKKSTTHSGDTEGNRVDLFMVNRHLKDYIVDVEMLEDMPFVNHYPIALTLDMPSKIPEVDETKPTTIYFDIPVEQKQQELGQPIWKKKQH